MKTKRFLSFVTLLTLVIATLAIPTTSCEAAAKKSGLKDTKSAYKEYRSDVQKLYKNGALKGLVKSGKFKPSKVIKRNEFTKILVNLYGDRFTVTSSMLSTKKVTYKWMYSTLTRVSDELGYKVTWSGYNTKKTVRRDAACNAIVTQITFAEGKEVDNLTPDHWK